MFFGWFRKKKPAALAKADECAIPAYPSQVAQLPSLVADKEPGPRRVHLVCFANSRKMAGRCVAGKRWAAGSLYEWIRPVGSGPTQALSSHQIAIPGGPPALLDILEIALGPHQPEECQTENHLVYPGVPWTRYGTLPRVQAGAFCDPPGALWVNGVHPNNDRIPEQVSATLGSSLRLIEVENGLWINEAFGGKPKYRLMFTHAGATYRLRVTDTVAEAKHAGPVGTTKVLGGPVMFCISLGEPFEGYRYKLVAGVI